MIISRGKGSYVIGFWLLTGLLFGAIASAIVPEEKLPFSMAVGLTLSGGAIWVVGTRLNQTIPRRMIEQGAAVLRADLDQQVANGTFQVQGAPAPEYRSQARIQADQLYELAIDRAKKNLNFHTMFWIPMQYYAILTFIAALFALYYGITQV